MQEPELPELPVLPDFITSHIDPLTGRDDTADFDGGDGYITTTMPPLVARRPAGQADENPYAEMDISRNAPCHCEIGRASCRERVCQYVSISVVTVSLKKKININKSISE